MEMYKKKPLKFSGLGRNIRTIELNAARGSSRLQRFSLQRQIDEIETPKENVPSISKIPTFGMQKSEVPLSRRQMLKKWKEDKMMKKKIDDQIKKPVFRYGGSSSKLQHGLASSNTSEYNRSAALSRIQESRLLSFSKKPPTPNCSISKATDCKVAVKPQATGTKYQASKNKADVIKPPTTRSQAVNTNPQACKFNTDNVTFRNCKPPTAIAKPTRQENKKVPNVASNAKPAKVTAAITTTDLKTSKKTTFSGLPRPAISHLPQLKQKPAPKPIGPTTCLNRPTTRNAPSQLSKPAVKISNHATVKQTGIASRKPAEKPKLGKELPKKEAELKKEQPEKVKDDSIPANITSRFPHQSLDPAEQKSFAPEGFVFCPPTELKDSLLSLFLDCNISSTYETLKCEMEKNENRTSTPKQSEWNKYKGQLDGSYTSKPPDSEISIIPTRERNSGSIPSSGTEFIELLLGDSLSHIKLKEPNSSLKLLEQEQVLETVPQKENFDQILRKANSLETRQPESCTETVPSDEFNPSKADTVGSEQSCITLSDTTPPKVIVTETNRAKNEFHKVNLTVQHETKGDSSIHLLQNSPSKIPPQSLSELEQRTAFDFCIPEKDGVKNSASEVSLLDLDKKNTNTSEFCVAVKDLVSSPTSELDLLQKNKSSPERDQATNVPSGIHSTVKELEDGDETGSLSDGVFEGVAISRGTRSKRFTRSALLSEKSTLLKISESPEIQETPKRVGRARMHEKANAGEFTPRRSERLARLSEYHSEENLFDVRESLYSSPLTESSRLTYDFDRLHLESGTTSNAAHRYSTRSSTVSGGGKVSLLYTPPRSRKSTRNRTTIKGDLMSFSPNV